MLRVGVRRLTTRRLATSNITPPAPVARPHLTLAVCAVLVFAVDLSLLYAVYIQVLRVDPPKELFAKLLTDTLCARPGLRQLYDTLLRLKASGHVHSIVMCTAARNTNGWVVFLRDVLEHWYGARIYDVVIDGEAPSHTRAYRSL
jgi:hypothetical protein